MRILYDSKKLKHKTPFGTLSTGETCTMTIYVPSSVQATMISCIINHADGSHAKNADLPFQKTDGLYDIFQGSFSMYDTGLYFYYFYIETENSNFNLYKYGYSDTNIEEGDKWQLSCVPKDFSVNDEFKGRVMYQIFPDRFFKSGDCDLSEKLTPYTIHSNKNPLYVDLTVSFST